jgi:hypothetical protein
MEPNLQTCRECGQEVDDEVCWCGDSMTHGWDGAHSPIPMGCDCHRGQAQQKEGG